MLVVVGPNVRAGTVKILAVALHLFDVTAEHASDVKGCFVVAVLPDLRLESVDLAAG